MGHTNNASPSRSLWRNLHASRIAKMKSPRNLAKLSYALNRLLSTLEFAAGYAQYSDCKAAVGLTPAAAHPGMSEAAKVTRSSKIGTKKNVSGSIGCTP
jgi:hypothetical protein